MRNSMVRCLVFVLSFLTIGQQHHAHATLPSSSDPYYLLGKKTVQVVEVSENSIPQKYLSRGYIATQIPELQNSSFQAEHSSTLPDASAGNSGGDLSFMEILTKTWDVIQKGKPSANVKDIFASALPKAAKDNWAAVVGWKPQRSFKVRITYPNLIGMTVVDFTYWVRMNYGGNYNGKGLFIQAAQIVPGKIIVANMFNLDMNVNVPSIYNDGKSEQDPVAALQMDVSWAVNTVWVSIKDANSYKLSGDGSIRDRDTGSFIFNPHPDLVRD